MLTTVGINLCSDVSCHSRLKLTVLNPATQEELVMDRKELAVCVCVNVVYTSVCVFVCKGRLSEGQRGLLGPQRGGHRGQRSHHYGTHPPTSSSS